LDTVNKSGIVVHGTVYMDNSEPLHNIPSYVINHGILNGEDLHTLLRRSKVRKILRSLYNKKIPKKDNYIFKCYCIFGNL